MKIEFELDEFFLTPFYELHLYTINVTKEFTVKPSDVIVKDGVEYFTKPVTEQRTVKERTYSIEYTDEIQELTLYVNDGKISLEDIQVVGGPYYYAGNDSEKYETYDHLIGKKYFKTKEEAEAAGEDWVLRGIRSYE